MLTDDALITVVKQAFQAQTRSVSASPQLCDVVRRRLRRRQAATLAAAGATAAAVCTVAVAVTAGIPHPPVAPAHSAGALPGPSTRTATSAVTGTGGGGTKLLRLSDYTFTIPAEARVSTTCLDNPQAWTNSWSPRPLAHAIATYMLIRMPNGNFGYTANGDSCDGAAFVYSTRTPTPVDTVSAAGKPTIYLAAPTPATRIGYFALDAHDSAWAAQQTGGPTGPTYYVIGEIPADNDQSVLVALLQQYPMSAQQDTATNPFAAPATTG